MALNVKLSLVVCLGFIAAMTWLLDQVAEPAVVLPTPLVTTPAAGPGPVAETIPQPSAARFATPSTFERETTSNPGLTPTMLMARRPEPEPEPVFAELPPRARVDEEILEPRGGSVQLAGYVEPDDLPAPQGLPAPAGGRAYTVQRGDTLGKIAREQCPWAGSDALEVLLTANPQLRERPNRILVGEKIRVPSAPGVAARAAETPPSAAPMARPAVAEAPAATGESRWYTIRKNDSLIRIAQRELRDATRWREIVHLNGLEDADRIVAGTRIKLPALVAMVGG